MHRPAIALLCLVPVLAGSTQPVTTRPAPDQPVRRYDGPQYAAWLPPGKYSSIILNSSGDQRRWAVSLMYRDKSVPIVVPPGDNIVIEFKDEWSVAAADEARIVSNLVPFDDSAQFNKVGEEPKYVLSAWGITSAGPVPFVYREIKREERRQLP
jgi:hypothetical protein